MGRTLLAGISLALGRHAVKMALVIVGWLRRGVVSLADAGGRELIRHSMLSPALSEALMMACSSTLLLNGPLVTSPDSPFSSLCRDRE